MPFRKVKFCRESSVLEEVAVKDLLKKLKFILNYGVMHINLYLFLDNLLRLNTCCVL
jgi:hypothetical protein